MPKTGKNIYKRKDGRWEGRYFKKRNAGGKIIYGYVYGKTCAEVKQRLMSFTAERPISAPVFSPDKNSITFTDVANQWKSVISLKVKASTYAGYMSTLELHILPEFGNRKIHSLTVVDMGLFAQNKLDNGRADKKGGLSAKTVRDMLFVIKAIIDFAFKENIIESGIAFTYPKQQQKKMRVLSHGEQSSLETVLRKDMDIHKLGIFLCLYTGLRVGEICALRWQDISPDFDILSIRETLQRVKNVNTDNTDENKNKTKILVDTPKSPRSAREIPVPKFLSPYLQNFAREDRAYFLSTKDNAFTEPRTMQNHFARSAKTANIAGANYHCLRHTFATRCIEADVDIKSLSEILGHSSVNITLNNYVHSSFEQKRKGIDKLEQYIGTYVP
jgi:integrase